MPRFALALILALIPFAAQAAKKAEPAQPVVAISDEEVVQRLSTTDVLAWERAQDLKKQGQSLVETGNRLVERKPGAFRDAEDIKRDQESGKRMITDGEAKIAEADAALNALRQKIAQQAPEEAPTSQSAVHKLEFKPEAYSEALLSRVVEQQLFDLWSMGYKRILLVGAWASKTDGPTALPELRTQIEDEMRRKDGNRYTLVPSQTEDYLYLVVKGTPAVNFPDKLQTLNNYRTALVYAELVPSPDRKETWISLRAVDAQNLDLIDARLLLCSNNADLDTLLLLDDEDKIEGLTTRPTEPISIVINDEADFVSRVSGSSYEFGVRYRGDESGFRSRQSAVLLKTILPPAGVQMSDSDFFARVLPSDEESAQEKVGYDALWQLEPQEPGLPLRQTYKLEAISLRGDEERALPVGTLEVASASADKPAAPKAN